MKNHFRLLLVMVMCVSCVACQTTPRSKPLTEMSDAEKKAVYMYGPVGTPKKEHSSTKKALAITAAVVVTIPLIIWAGLAASGSKK
jgi:hypothetical protein